MVMMWARAFSPLFLLAASAVAKEVRPAGLHHQNERSLQDIIMIGPLDFGGDAARGDTEMDISGEVGMPAGCLIAKSDDSVFADPEKCQGSRRNLMGGVDLQQDYDLPPTAIQVPPFGVIGTNGWVHVYAITLDFWNPDSSKRFCDFSGYVQHFDPAPGGPIIPWDMYVSPGSPTDSVGRKCRTHILYKEPGADCLLSGFAIFGYPTPAEPAGCSAGLQTLHQPTIEGEPHFSQWNGHKFDYQGECDLVFAHAPDFGYGVGLDIHARTKIRYDYSYIETAAIKIGDDVLEVSSFGDYFLNGVLRADLEGATLAGYPITYKQPMEKKFTYDIELGGGNVLAISSMKDIVSIRFVHAKENEGLDLLFEWFGNSSGMIGSLDTGKSMMGRDGVTQIMDANAYGEEWQVRGSDPRLFQNAERAPQYPEKCNLPSPDAYQTQRRLGVGISQEAAAKACENWPKDQKENCINDVIAMGDLEFAQAGAY